ncbi:MAG: hypothetical protein N2510_04175, partial [Ignavibacteria bacterium]|nr:hypothetical protein [Ignavibacteria bacterium]
MPWVITKLCIDCRDTECAEVCPVDCIYQLKVEDAEFLIVSSGTIASTARISVDRLREKGYKIGLLRVRVF